MSSVVVLRDGVPGRVDENEVRVDGESLTRPVGVCDYLERAGGELDLDGRVRCGEGIGLFEGFRLCSEKCPE